MYPMVESAFQAFKKSPHFEKLTKKLTSKVTTLCIKCVIVLVCVV